LRFLFAERGMFMKKKLYKICLYILAAEDIFYDCLELVSYIINPILWLGALIGIVTGHLFLTFCFLLVIGIGKIIDHLRCGRAVDRNGKFIKVRKERKRNIPIKK
jgi:hypothetical protein